MTPTAPPRTISDRARQNAPRYASGVCIPRVLPGYQWYVWDTQDPFAAVFEAMGFAPTREEAERQGAAKAAALEEEAKP